MFAQQNQLKELFEQYGWELLETHQPEKWWITDFWVIKSLWTPTDCKVYLSFLVDDQLDARTISKLSRENSWLNVGSIQFSLKDPNEIVYPEFLEADASFVIFIKSQWENRIPEVFEGLKKLRNKFNKTIGAK